MGTQYILFRLFYTVAIQMGWWRTRFPVRFKPIQHPTLQQWRANTPAFFVSPKVHHEGADEEAATISQSIRKHQWPFFYCQWYTIDQHDWLTHPVTGFQYPLHHWTTISDFSASQGDIKYVWERARFSWVWYMLRDAAHNGGDHAEFLFETIDSFITQNPINKGPNYKCSQEISIRIMNWLAILYYYKHDAALTEERFRRIMDNIYGSVHHVWKNIAFSRIAVRNNHAITETLLLALLGHFFPWWKQTKRWSASGQAWFAEEIKYQISPDGTFLQYSMNYHRVVVQLLTWAIRLEELGAVLWPKIVRERAAASLKFLQHSTDNFTGQTPNYGPNDGALFFPMSASDYRDFRPQLSALAHLLNKPYETGLSDSRWYGSQWMSQEPSEVDEKAHYYGDGGYFIASKKDGVTFLRAGSHPHRPGQADNFHLDIWWNGRNLLRDAGTYRYNGHHPAITFCSSTAAHNTLSIPDTDQMLKGPRFTWFYWSQLESYREEATEMYWEFEGVLKAFQHIDSSLRHKRKLRVYRNQARWEVEDTLLGEGNWPMRQYWHPHPDSLSLLQIEAHQGNHSLQPTWAEGWYARQYATVEQAPYFYFTGSINQTIHTTITTH